MPQVAGVVLDEEIGVAHASCSWSVQMPSIRSGSGVAFGGSGDVEVHVRQVHCRRRPQCSFSGRRRRRRPLRGRPSSAKRELVGARVGFQDAGVGGIDDDVEKLDQREALAETRRRRKGRARWTEWRAGCRRPWPAGSRSRASGRSTSFRLGAARALDEGLHIRPVFADAGARLRGCASVQ